MSALSDAAGVQAALVAALQRRLDGAVAIERLQALSGGANNQTWRFTLDAGTASGDYVLRRAPVAGPGGLDKRAEAEVQIAAARAGIPVAPVAWILEPADALGAGYIMRWVDGETIPRRIQRDVEFAGLRADFAAGCGRMLAAIHAIEPAVLPALPLQDADAQILEYRAAYARSGLRLPVIELAFRWLERHLPPPAVPRLVHGDFRLGNFLVGPEGVRAVLDWELAHRGDPAEDLAWVCVNSWRFGNRALPVGGCGTRAQLFAAYTAAGGCVPDPARVHFWEVLGTLKWGVICMMMSNAGGAGGPASVERAAIGRRISETGIDLLELLEGKGP